MRSILIVAALLVVTGCGELKTPTGPGGGGDPIDQTATLTRVQAEIFTPSCATIGCHDPLGQQSSLILSAGRTHAMTVGRPSVQIPSLDRIEPFDPAASYLYRKLTGSGITGDRMPQGRAPLTDAQLELVRDWIRRGAPND